jgi:hypothetical protein
LTISDLDVSWHAAFGPPDDSEPATCQSHGRRFGVEGEMLAEEKVGLGLQRRNADNGWRQPGQPIPQSNSS